MSRASARPLELPTHDAYGRPFGRGLASLAAQLQLAARAELDAALHAPLPARHVEHLRRARGLLAPGGPVVNPDGSRDEGRRELLSVTAGAAPAAAKLRRALRQLPEPAAAHTRAALAFAVAAQAIRGADHEAPA